MAGTQTKPPTVPVRPRLRPGTEIIRIDNERILLRSFSGTVLLSGEFAADGLPSLLEQLDGDRTTEEIAAVLGGGRRHDLEELLVFLMSKGVLVDQEVARPERDGGAREYPQQAYWTLHDAVEGTALRSLRSSNVVIAGLGGVGMSMAAALAAAGVGRIVAIDPGRVRSEDELRGYGAQDLGSFRAEAAASRISGHQATACTPIVASVESLPTLEPIVSDADLVVLASDNMSLAGYDATNEICIRHRKPWVSARVDRNQGIIGPFVVPGQTACFTCFELRSRVNAEHPADHEALYRHWKSVDSTPDDWPTLGAFLSVIGNMLALDVQRVLAGRQLSVVRGRILSLDLQTLESRFHEVLKLPRCPACSRARERPMTKIWDIRMAPEDQLHENS